MSYVFLMSICFSKEVHIVKGFQVLTFIFSVLLVAGKYGIICVEDMIHQIYTVGPKFKRVNNFLWPFKVSLFYTLAGILTEIKLLIFSYYFVGNAI